MYDVVLINNLSEFLEHNQIISLLKDQMDYIDSPKTNEELIHTIKLAFRTECAKLICISERGHIIGFAFFNVCVGMESAGKYIWLNEMHIHKDFRGKGFGTVLFKEIEKWCIDNEIVRILGMTTEKEKRTLNFYKKQGSVTFSQDIFSLKLPKK